MTKLKKSFQRRSVCGAGLDHDAWLSGWDGVYYYLPNIEKITVEIFIMSEMLGLRNNFVK